MLFEILTGQVADFGTVNREIPAVGKHHTAWRLLPDGGRLIQTHEAYRTEYLRAIYLVRDVRDVVISEHAYQRWAGLSDTEFVEFLLPFLEGKVNGYGSWYHHVTSWLSARLAENRDVLIIRFEDMRKYPNEILAEILDFLHVTVEPEVICDAIRNNTLERMRSKEDEARSTILKGSRQDMRFVRRGSVEGWRHKLADKQVQLIEQSVGAVLAQMGYSITSPSAKQRNQL